ncbi:NAD(P)/FAD-dependent oxidoreductase [Candidatus Woesearchaeota archaeon]|nr:NAD(P)/FAD-dependent oxidoreductase [Candidatus Woesearchaeota archaeon]
MIAIVGAGPVGCYVASLLAAKHDVLVVEEHKSVGLPVQCTGIVTQEIFDFISGKHNNFIINEVNDVRIFSPNNKFISLKLEQPDLILDRQKFDLYFFKLARKKGVKFLFNHRFISRNGSKIIVKNLDSGRTKKFKCSHLIGADGPRSIVAKCSGLYNKRKFFIGVQAVIKKKNNNIIDFYPFKGGFGWAVPENNNTLRVGVASLTNPKNYFQELLKKYPGKIICKQGGLIPLFDPWTVFCKQKTYLVGDAASFVKATTGGGIITGLKSAELAARSINHNINYDALVIMKLFPSLLLNLKMRKTMDNFTENDWNDLIKELNNPKSRKALQSINRDRLFSLVFKSFLNNPKLIRFGLK